MPNKLSVEGKNEKQWAKTRVRARKWTRTKNCAILEKERRWTRIRIRTRTKGRKWSRIEQKEWTITKKKNAWYNSKKLESFVLKSELNSILLNNLGLFGGVELNYGIWS